MAKIVVGDIIKVLENGKFGKIKTITEDGSAAIVRIGPSSAIYTLDKLEFVRKGEGAMEDTTTKEFKPVTHMSPEEATALLEAEEKHMDKNMDKTKKVENVTSEPVPETSPKKPTTKKPPTKPSKPTSKKVTGKAPKSAPKTPEKALVDNTPKAPKKKTTGIKKGSIGEYALKLLGDKSLADKTYEELAEMVRAKFNSKTSSACFGWYYSKHKNFLGLIPRIKKAKPNPKTAHPIDSPKTTKKAPTKPTKKATTETAK